MNDHSALSAPLRSVAGSEQRARIVCLTTRFGTGGAELNAQMLARSFIERGYRAELWCLYRAGDLAHADVPVRVFAENRPASPLAIARMARDLRRAFHEDAPDRIFGFQPLANVLAGALHLPSTQFVATQRNPSDSQSWVLRRLERWVNATARCDANIAVSQAVADSYGHYGQAYCRKLRVVHNGLPPLLPVDDDKQAARRALGLPVGVPLIGNVSRLHHQKNPEFLIALMEQLPDVHLMLAGDGPDEAALRAAAGSMADRIHFLGRVEGADITRCYRAVDVFVFPSRYEGFGRSLIEAMAMEAPVVAHDMPVSREVVGSHGILLPLETGRWAAAVRRVLAGDHPDLAAAKRHTARFSLEAMVDGYLGILPLDRAAK